MPANTSQIASLRRSVGLEKDREILESHAFHLDVFCSVCCSGFKVSKTSHASEHVKTAKHEKGIELSKPKQQQLRLHPKKKLKEDSVVFVSRNWITLKSYLETIKDSNAAKNALRFMKSQNTLNEVAEVASLEFLVNLISVSEARDFTIVKAVKQIETIVEKLVDLKETGNKTADAALTKFTKILDTNRGITDVKRNVGMGKYRGAFGNGNLCFCSCYFNRC